MEQQWEKADQPVPGTEEKRKGLTTKRQRKVWGDEKDLIMAIGPYSQNYCTLLYVSFALIKVILKKEPEKLVNSSVMQGKIASPRISFCAWQ